MGKTSIEWTDDTWNPVTGCTKISAGCRNCYAERMALRLQGMQNPRYANGFGVTLHEDKLGDPLRWKKPKRIFVNSMSDLFHDDVPDEFIKAVFGVMAATPRHTYQVLTKRPQRMLEWFKRITTTNTPPDLFVQRAAYAAGVEIPLHHIKGTLLCRPWPLLNVWLGVSCENQAAADERIPLLMQTPAAVRFLSLEPLLESIDLSWPFTIWPEGPPMCCRNGEGCGCMGLPTEPPLIHGINWVIVGAETGPGARMMDPDWARTIRGQCAEFSVPFFFKQMSAKAPIPADLMVREFPAEEKRK